MRKQQQRTADSSSKRSARFRPFEATMAGGDTPHHGLRGSDAPPHLAADLDAHASLTGSLEPSSGVTSIPAMLFGTYPAVLNIPVEAVITAAERLAKQQQQQQQQKQQQQQSTAADGRNKRLDHTLRQRKTILGWWPESPGGASGRRAEEDDDGGDHEDQRPSIRIQTKGLSIDSRLDVGTTLTIDEDSRVLISPSKRRVNQSQWTVPDDSLEEAHQSYCSDDGEEELEPVDGRNVRSPRAAPVRRTDRSTAGPPRSRQPRSQPQQQHRRHQRQSPPAEYDGYPASQSNDNYDQRRAYMEQRSTRDRRSREAIKPRYKSSTTQDRDDDIAQSSRGDNRRAKGVQTAPQPHGDENCAELHIDLRTNDKNHDRSSSSRVIKLIVHLPEEPGVHLERTYFYLSKVFAELNRKEAVGADIFQGDTRTIRVELPSHDHHRDESRPSDRSWHQPTTHRGKEPVVHQAQSQPRQPLRRRDEMAAPLLSPSNNSSRSRSSTRHHHNRRSSEASCQQQQHKNTRQEPVHRYDIAGPTRGESFSASHARTQQLIEKALAEAIGHGSIVHDSEHDDDDDELDIIDFQPDHRAASPAVSRQSQSQLPDVFSDSFFRDNDDINELRPRRSITSRSSARPSLQSASEQCSIAASSERDEVDLFAIE